MSIKTFISRLLGWDRPDAVSIFEGIMGLKRIGEECRAKDTALYDALSYLPISDFWRAWKDVYPEDFPQGGMTSVTDVNAIKR